MPCHLCIYWTPEDGCDHYGPDKKREQLLKDIVAFTHKGRTDIVETRDFRDGAKYAIRYLIEKGVLKSNQLKNINS
jgi:hypothetical protein